MDLRIIEIADHYGKDHQTEKLKEELQELIDALEEGKPDHIIEEMADVFIMLLQYVWLFGIKKSIDRVVQKKLKRQIDRMEKEGKEDEGQDF